MAPADGARAMKPQIIAWIVAAALALPIAHSVFRIPIQVSDSLEPIVISARYPNTAALLRDSVRFSPTTFRPMRYLQARGLLEAAESTGLTYHAVFRTVHVALLLMLVALFVLAARVREWTDLAAFTVALPVFVGIHTFVAMLQEAFPVNHYAEVAVCVLAVLWLAQRPPRWFVAPLICLLLVLALSVIESGAMVWVAVVASAAARLRGITRATLISTTVVVVAYVALRRALDIASPGIGGHGSGFGATFYSAEELAQRFGAHPLALIAYNVAGGFASLLLSEPRQGVYSLAMWWRDSVLHPVVVINLVSSVVTTAVLVWYGVTHLRGGYASWSHRQRLFVVACALMVINAALTAAYIKDEIISPGCALHPALRCVQDQERLGGRASRRQARGLAEGRSRAGDHAPHPRRSDFAPHRQSFLHAEVGGQVLGRVTRSLLVRTLPALPCAILAAMSAWWIAGDLAGGGLWPADEVTLSEAIATRNTAEALRLIRLGADPNQPSRVRGGLLTSDADVTVRPVEAAVGAQRADALRMLLANGAAIDNRERRVLRCYEQRRHDSGVRELLGGESETLDCSGVRLPTDEGSR
ncbi:MAG: hypothetical protein DMF87_27725 [Acidobacteria bacterium]|nr:MAG: hypothetical protein DMF87_27725 [Acidobacteriota bacterium]